MNPLVEDDDTVRTVARSILERNGYRVLEASSAREALLLCERHQSSVDLLLTDVIMPRMSGGELAERLCSSRPKMRVLYMSGYAEDTIVHHRVLESGTSLLQKLCKVREVLDGVRPK